MKQAFLFLGLLSLNLFAGDKHKHNHSAHSHGHGKSLKAHVHGEAKMAVALESDQKIHIELEVPGESLFGFEHAPKTDKEKQHLQAQSDALKNNAGSWLQTSAKCTWTPSLEVVYEGNHSEVEAVFVGTCESSLKNTDLKVDFSKVMPALSSLKVEYLGSKAKTLTLKKGNGVLKLD